MSARARPVVEVAALRALNNGFKQLRSMSSRPAHNFLFPSSSASSPPAAQVSHSTSTCEGVGVLASSFRPPMTVCSSPQTGSRCLTQTSSRFQTARKALSARQQAGGHRLWPMDNVSDKAGLHKMQLERSFFGSASPFSPPEANEHRERRLVRYCPEQVFHVVSSIEQYPLFLPWCKDAVIKSSKGNEDNSMLRAEMSVGFRGLSESYISEVTLQKPNKIVVNCVDSRLFTEMRSEWLFGSGPDEYSCWLDFKVRFCFSNHIYNQVASMFQDEVADRKSVV